MRLYFQLGKLTGKQRQYENLMRSKYTPLIQRINSLIHKQVRRYNGEIDVIENCNIYSIYFIYPGI